MQSSQHIATLAFVSPNFVFIGATMLSFGPASEEKTGVALRDNDSLCLPSEVFYGARWMPDGADQTAARLLSF